MQSGSSPPAVPFDTSGIRGCDRLCEAISSMFVEKEGIQYLGLYGMEGSGKSTICCEAMCNFFQKDFRSRFCVVELECEKAADGKAAAKKREARLRQTIQRLIGLNKDMSAITTEGQGRQYLKDRLCSQRVFLVVDNVSPCSREEAEFYVNAGMARASKVLVTSRSPKILEFLLGGPQYCRPTPGLEDREAAQLFLSKAASSRLDSRLEPAEIEVLQDCVAECYINKHYHPLTVIAMANYLQGRDENDILSWRQYIESLRRSNEAKDFHRFLLLEYERLDKTSKLIFLDLAIFANGIYYTHLDFHRELEWDEHDNFKHVVTYIALLHGISFQQAKMKVKKLQRMSFLDNSNTEICVPESFVEFARWLIRGDGGREEKDWCMICEQEDVYEEDEDEEDLDVDEEDADVFPSKLQFAHLPNVFPSKLVRVSVSRLSLVYSDHLKIQQWRYVAYLELGQVNYLRCLDLQGLHSLRVLRVEDCEDLEKLVCTCNNLSPSDAHFCCANQSGSGCMPNLRFVQLEFLPSLKYASFPMHCWNLETLWFFVCPNLVCLPDLRFCKKLKKLRLPCGDFNGFQGLGSNQALTELAFQWDPKTVRNFTQDMQRKMLHDVMNLPNLTILDIVDEREVFVWIPAGIRLNVGRLVLLTFLDLSCATTIQEVEGLERLSHLTSLGLYGCSELRRLPNLHAFQKLKRLCIGHCHRLSLTDRYDLPWKVEDFHALGESCSFGEHRRVFVTV